MSGDGFETAGAPDGADTGRRVELRPDGSVRFSLSAGVARTANVPGVALLVLGVLGLLSLIIALADTSDDGPPAGGLVAIGVISAVLTVLGASVLTGRRRALRTADDLIVGAWGITREAPGGRFSVPWDAIARVDVVASDAHTSAFYLPMNNPLPAINRANLAPVTVLRFTPTDPLRFPTYYPALDSSRANRFLRTVIDAPFGVVLPINFDVRPYLADAIARHGGTRFGGVSEDSAYERWRTRNQR